MKKRKIVRSLLMAAMLFGGIFVNDVSAQADGGWLGSGGGRSGYYGSGYRDGGGGTIGSGTRTEDDGTIGSGMGFSEENGGALGSGGGRSESSGSTTFSSIWEFFF